MHIDHLRYHTDDNYTKSVFYINKEYKCFILEDKHNDIKIYGETRIPVGTREITLRKEGGMHYKYLQKFGEVFHKGMLWIRNVKDFKYVYIHIGNSSINTLGCLLTGASTDMDKDWVANSTKAYKKIYPEIAEAILRGEKVTITTINLESTL